VKEEVMRPKNKTIQAAEDARLREGLVEILGSAATLRVEGKEVKIRDVLDALDRIAARAAATSEAKGQFHRAVAAEKEERAQVSALLSAVRAALRATSSPEELLACGLAPRKAPRVLSAEERVLKAVKLRATRAANRTRGVRQVREERVRAGLAAAYTPNGSEEASRPLSPSVALSSEGRAGRRAHGTAPSSVGAGGEPPDPFA
jgi:hypothetical protein